MTSLGEAVVEVGADTTGFRKDVDTGVQKALGNATKSMKEIGRTMSSVGKQATLGITAPIVGIGIASVKSAGQFETSMNMLQAAAGISGKPLENLRQQAIQLGADTVFSANEAADAMLELGRSGMNAAQVSKTVPQVLNLAATEGLGLAQSAGIVTSALAQFGLEADQAGKVVNALAGASNASKASVASISEALVYAGGAAANAGLSVQETSAALAALSQVGLEGSVAGTSLASVLNHLVPQTDAARAAMKELGITFVNNDGSFKSISQIAGILQSKFANMGEAARAVKLREIFGRDASAIQAVNGLIAQGAEGMVNLTEKSNDQSAAAKLAAARMKGVQGALERMKGALSTAGLVIGNALVPAIKTAANFIGNMAEKFANLPGPIQKIILVIAAIAAAIGPVLLVVGSLVAAIGAIATASAPVVLAIGGVVVGVAALVAGLILLTKGFRAAWEHSALFRSFVAQSFDAVIIVINAALWAFKQLFAALGHVPGFGWATNVAEGIETVRQHLKDLDEKVTKSAENFKKLGKSAEDQTAALTRMFILTTLPDKLRAAFTKLPKQVQLDFSTNVPQTIQDVAKLAASIKNVKPAQIKAILDASGVQASVAQIQAEISKQRNIPVGLQADQLVADLAAAGTKISHTEAKMLLGADPATFNEVLVRSLTTANDSRPTPKLNLNRTIADVIIKQYVKDANSQRPTPKLYLDDSAARDTLDSFIQDALSEFAILKSKSETYGVFANPSSDYTGGRVPAGFAGGGIVPGRPPTNRRQDNVLAMSPRNNPLLVRSGEWIINERASQDNDRLLAAINNGAKFRTAEVITSSPQSQVVHETTNISHTNVFNGPESFSEGRREDDWRAKYGTRYGAATEPAGL